MKKVLSFALAVALAFSLLLGSAFASSGVTVVAPDTFISWGSFDDLTSLAAPSDAVSDGNKYIIYQIRDWVGFYFRVRFVIDSFSRGDPVEGETLSWTRYTGKWGVGVNAALEPASYEVERHVAEKYTYSQNFLHRPVKSNFDYYDANGELIISGSGYVNEFNGLMDLTLIDGTVIQVPRLLVGNQFVVARSAVDGSQYRIWNFGTPDTLNGIYEGSAGVLYSISDGSLASSSLVIDGVTVPDIASLVDLAVYPYLFVFTTVGSGNVTLVYSVDPMLGHQTATSFIFTSYNSADKRVFIVNYSSADSTFNDARYVSGWGSTLLYSSDVYSSSYPIYSYKDNSLLVSPSFSLTSSNGWSWSPWNTMSTALDITQYGDIVYQTFDYPLSNPDDEPSESPDPEPSPSPGGTPDDSNNGLFSWLKMQWVFLLQKLQNIVDAIKNLSVDLDPYPDKTKPLLDDFFVNIFDNGVGEEDVAGLGGVLQNVRSWFETDFKMGDLWDLFDEEYMTSWFTEETRLSIDSTGGDLNGS